MKASILVVDADLEIRRTIETVFSREGCRVSSSGSGEEALKLLKQKSFDVVITDIRMPGISGLAWLERIRTLDENVEIVVLTGFNTVQNIIKALRDVRVADYLLKPLNDMEDLVSSVKKVFQKRKLCKEIACQVN